MVKDWRSKEKPSAPVMTEREKLFTELVHKIEIVERGKVARDNKRKSKEHETLALREAAVNNSLESRKRTSFALESDDDLCSSITQLIADDREIEFSELEEARAERWREQMMAQERELERKKREFKARQWEFARECKREEQELRLFNIQLMQFALEVINAWSEFF